MVKNIFIIILVIVASVYTPANNLIINVILVAWRPRKLK
jgi:hypothetical protein